jgi:O-acetyl-ADP-ribose deacetylase (regulator of RNase III)
MIHEVRGDILLSHAQVIAHAVAPHDHFSQGLALSLRQQWPALVKDFHHFCHAMHPKAGDVWVWSGAMSKRVISLLTNEAPLGTGGKPPPARKEVLELSLRELRNLLESKRFTHIALPRLATGAGGLDWKVVEPLIERHLGDLDLPIYIYTQYEEGVQAIEPGLSRPGGVDRKPDASHKQ